MAYKRHYQSPSVLHAVSVALEEEMLAGQSAVMQVIAAGQDYFEWNTDVEDIYTVDDWQFD